MTRADLVAIVRCVSPAITDAVVDPDARLGAILVTVCGERGPVSPEVLHAVGERLDDVCPVALVYRLRTPRPMPVILA